VEVAQLLLGGLAVIGAMALYQGAVPIDNDWLWLVLAFFVLPLIPHAGDGFVREEGTASNGS
jgi:hypothetical protein